MVEMQVPILEFNPTQNDGILPTFMGVYDPLNGSNSAGWGRFDTSDLLMVRPFSGSSSTPEYRATAGDRLSVSISPDGTAAFYVNYLGASSDPWYVAPIKLDLSAAYKLLFFNEADFATGVPDGTDITVGIRNTRWLRNIPEYAYTGDMQREDHSGSLPSSVFVGVRKRSAHPLGPPSDWLYATFVRP